MNTEQMTKRTFVERLSFAAQADDRLDVKRLEYKLFPERVEITYRNGYVKSVCVEGDSCRAIALDVFQRI